MSVPLPPPTRLHPISERGRQKILNEIAAGSAVGRAWREKLRRYASLNGRQLRNSARARFGAVSDAHLIWIGEALSHVDPATGQPDAAALNGALFAADAVKSDYLSARVQGEVNKLRNWLLDMSDAEKKCSHRPRFGNRKQARLGQWLSSRQCIRVSTLLR